VEGEDGLTPRQKRELTAKMVAAVGKKHRQMKEAEEFAAEQYNNRRLAEAKAAELERELKAKAPTPQVEEAKAPDRKDFPDDAAYWDAVVAHKVSLALKAERENEVKAAAEKRQAQILEKASERIKQAMDLVPDF